MGRLTCLLLLVLSSTAFAENADLHFRVPINRPLLIEINNHFDGYLSIESGSFDWSSDWVSDRELVFVDEYQELTDSVERATRHVVRDRSKFNGEIGDSALNGIVANYSYGIDDDEEWEVKLDGNRALTGKLFDRLFNTAGSLGFWLKFPEDNSLGDQFDLDLGLLAPLFLGGASTEDSIAELEIAEFDSLSGKAVLRGRATLTGVQVLADTDVRITSKGELQIELSTLEKRICKFDFDGRFNLSIDRGGVSASGEGIHKITVETDLSTKNIRSAKRKKPNFRTRRIYAERLGVGIKLPSHWTRVGSGTNRVFVRTLDHDKGEVLIELKLLEVDSSYQPQLALDKIYGSLRESNPGVTYKKTSNPLRTGPARVFYFPPGPNDEELLQTEIYPWRGQFLMYRISGSREGYRAAFKEFQAAKRTIGALNPKRTR